MKITVNLDILWFDAGWVSESNGQDIELGKIVEEARKIQPWILSVDRTIGGAYENYVTPELCIPEEPLNVPWESCLTLGVDFTYEYGDHYKSPRELVGMLVNIVAKGGNMALNVSPQPDGRIPVDAWDSLNGFGQWMKPSAMPSTEPASARRTRAEPFRSHRKEIPSMCSDCIRRYRNR